MKYKNTVQVENLPSGLKSLVKKFAGGLGQTVLKQQTDPQLHITVLYGIKTDQVERVGACFLKPFTVKSEDEVQYFQNDGQTVALIRVTGRGLKKLHDDLKKQVGSTDDHPTYKGHITIAYLKKGRKLPKQKIQSFVWEVDQVVLRVNGAKKKVKAGMKLKQAKRYIKKLTQSVLRQYGASDNQRGGGTIRRPKMQSVEVDRLRQLRGIEDQPEAKKKLRFLRSRLQSQSGDDAKQTKREIRYYQERMKRGKMQQGRIGTDPTTGEAIYGPNPTHPWSNKRFTKRRHTQKGRGHTGKGVGGSYLPSNLPASHTSMSDRPGDEPKSSWRTHPGDVQVRSRYRQKQEQPIEQLDTDKLKGN